jgi:two-component system response regulator AtoC
MTNSVIEGTRLLVVSSDSAILGPLWSVGESNGWHLEIAADPWEAIERVKARESLDVIVMDLPHGSSEGLHSLRWLRRLRPELPVILIGHADDNGRRQEGIRMGARDYLVRPIECHQLEIAIQSGLSMPCEAFEAEVTSEDVEHVSDEGFFIGVSPIMRKLRAQAALLAEANVPVLILGEAGSGKETIARLIHKLSIRSGFAFAKVNCAALPGDLLERELLGYERKSAAPTARICAGKLELCARGTILLDEFTEISSSLQSTLMQVLDKRRFNRPGTVDLIEADVRVMAASSKNVKLLSSGGLLAEELCDRLSNYTIHVPPLRDRQEELSLLSRHLMHRLARQYGLPPREFSPTMMEAWRAYDWPGNLRELEQSVKRYIMVGDEESAIDMRPSLSEGDAQRAGLETMRSVKQMATSPNQPGASVPDSRSLRSLLNGVKAEAEKNAIAVALEKTGWNRKAAARLLDVSYRTVLYKIEEYRLSAPDSPVYMRMNGTR